MSVDSGPSGRCLAVTTSDTNAQPVGRGLFVGTGGNIVGRLVNDSADTTWKNVPSGSLLAVQFAFIRATNTTATDMIIVF